MKQLTPKEFYDEVFKGIMRHDEVTFQFAEEYAKYLNRRNFMDFSEKTQDSRKTAKEFLDDWVENSESYVPGKYIHPFDVSDIMDAYAGHYCRPFVQALSDLCDVQNGPPLAKYEKDWKDVMERAKKLINEHY